VAVPAKAADRGQGLPAADPGSPSRIAHPTRFPDYTAAEPMPMAAPMLTRQNRRFDDPGRAAFARRPGARRAGPAPAPAREDAA
jgi:hypothetical protein